MIGISTILSFFSRNLNIIKYGLVAILLTVAGYYGYKYYNIYEDALNENKVFKEQLAKKDFQLKTYIERANENARLLKEQEEYYESVMNEVKEVNKNRLAKLEEKLKIKEKTYYEEDGNVAPVLSNTIDRLFTEESNTRD